MDASSASFPGSNTQKGEETRQTHGEPGFKAQGPGPTLCSVHSPYEQGTEGHQKVFVSRVLNVVYSSLKGKGTQSKECQEERSCNKAHRSHLSHKPTQGR